METNLRNPAIKGVFTLIDYNTVNNPLEGMLAYDFLGGTVMYYNGSQWLIIGSPI